MEKVFLCRLWSDALPPAFPTTFQTEAGPRPTSNSAPTYGPPPSTCSPTHTPCSSFSLVLCFFLASASGMSRLGAPLHPCGRNLQFLCLKWWNIRDSSNTEAPPHPPPPVPKQEAEVKSHIFCVLFHCSLGEVWSLSSWSSSDLGQLW